MKIIIIGSGLMGIASAFYLSEQGHEITVIDRQSGPARETSFANAGVLHPSQASPWNHPGIARQILGWMGKEDSPFLLRASALPSLFGWGLSFLRHASPERFRANLQSNTVLANYNMQCLQELLSRHPISYSASSLGSLKVLDNEQDMEKQSEAVSLFTDLGVNCKILNQAEIFALEPALVENGKKLVGGIHYVDDQAGDAHEFCLQLAALAQQNQVRFEYDTRVSGFEKSGQTVTAVKTDRGDYQADAFVLAAGSYSPILARSVKLNLPIRPVKGYSITVDMSDWENPPRMPVIDETAHVAIVPLGNQLRAAGTAELTGYNTELNQRRVQMVIDQVTARYPAASESVKAGRFSSWAGLRPSTSDGVPIIGASPFNNLYLNTGQGHLGWTFALGSGKLLADLLGSKPVDIKHEPYSYARF
ncbi:MAG: amino acid oxidase [Gammaproteobacteria bacterium]|nr:amino acid oxidase [Gammaproteobacteria bacterium]|tara:strand:- start:248901 stop:250160 length:1260 start_codon:yes stop_codon:yes gene_type:complete